MVFRWTSLRAKALWTVAPLALVLLALAGTSVAERYRTLERMRELRSLARVSTAVGRLVHETQKERGLSSGFAASSGQQFSAELHAQRAATDRTGELLRALAHQDTGRRSQADQMVEAALRALDSLTPARRAVDALSVSGAQAADAYTRLNAKLLGTSRQIADLSQDVEVARAARAYSHFLHAKELAGIERAILMSAFTADSFAPGIYQRFVANGAMLEQRLQTFRDEATPEQRAYLADGMRAPAATLVAQMQALAGSKGVEGGFGIAPASWFQAATDRIDLLKKVETRIEEDLEKLASVQEARAEHDIAAFLAAVAAGLLVAIAVSWLVTNRTVGSIRAAIHLAARIASGDLTLEVRSRSKDEVGELMSSLEAMRMQLAGTVRRIGAVSAAVRSGATEIAAGNQDLSQRTEEQAASLEETAASMEELTGTVRQNAENALQADQLAKSAAEVALKGGRAVAEIVETMGSIGASSRKIVDIISVIDGIAFQTNILALNAAVEAARAGEQGRGFAVVAADVRGLAQRSAAAAKEVKALIDESVAKVSAGTELVSRAGTTMDQVVSGIKRATDIMGDIAVASQEQTRGIVQVNQAIAQMDQVTQQNAALVEQAAAAAQSMREQARVLVEAVSVFRLADEQMLAAPVQVADRDDADAPIALPRAESKLQRGSCGADAFFSSPVHPQDLSRQLERLQERVPAH